MSCHGRDRQLLHPSSSLEMYNQMQSPCLSFDSKKTDEDASTRLSYVSFSFLSRKEGKLVPSFMPASNTSLEQLEFEISQNYFLVRDERKLSCQSHYFLLMSLRISLMIHPPRQDCLLFLFFRLESHFKSQFRFSCHYISQTLQLFPHDNSFIFSKVFNEGKNSFA